MSTGFVGAQYDTLVRAREEDVTRTAQISGPNVDAGDVKITSGEVIGACAYWPNPRS